MNRRPEGRLLTIYEAAAEVFVREGYAGATGKALATAAEVAESTLFRLVNDKESLYTNLFDFAWSEINGGIADAAFVADLEAPERLTDPAEALVADGRAIAEMFDDQRKRPLVTFAFDALGRDPDRFTPAGSLPYGRFRQRFVNFVTLHQRRIGAPPHGHASPDAVADGLIARLRGTWMAWFYTPAAVMVRRPTVDDLSEQLRADLGLDERPDTEGTPDAPPERRDETGTGQRAAS